MSRPDFIAGFMRQGKSAFVPHRLSWIINRSRPHFHALWVSRCDMTDFIERRNQKVEVLASKLPMCRLYRKRAYTTCPCPILALSRFRYSPKTNRELNGKIAWGSRSDPQPRMMEYTLGVECIQFWGLRKSRSGSK